MKQRERSKGFWIILALAVISGFRRRFCLGCVDQTIRGDDGKLVTAQPRARPMLNLAISRNRQGQNCIQMSPHLRPQSWRNGGHLRSNANRKNEGNDILECRRRAVVSPYMSHDDVGVTHVSKVCTVPGSLGTSAEVGRVE
jgi:hypothetical protein